jgi:hypothetical protein
LSSASCAALAAQFANWANNELMSPRREAQGFFKPVSAEFIQKTFSKNVYFGLHGPTLDWAAKPSLGFNRCGNRKFSLGFAAQPTLSACRDSRFMATPKVSVKSITCARFQ